MDINAQRADIQQTVHSLDKRVSVLETRTDQQGREIRDMRTDIKDTKEAVGEIHTDLRDYITQEAKDRTKLFQWIAATMIGVVVSIALAVFRDFLG